MVIFGKRPLWYVPVLGHKFHGVCCFSGLELSIPRHEAHTARKVQSHEEAQEECHMCRYLVDHGS